MQRGAAFVCAPWVRVPPGEKPVGELVHLALEAGCWEGLITRRPVLDGERCSVALLEGREGEKNLDDRSHIAAVVSFKCARAYLQEGDKTHLLPRFCNPVRPGPKMGSRAFPDSSVSLKSKLRLCSIC